MVQWYWPVRTQLSIALTPPTKQPFDLDNRCKATIDLLVAHRVIESDDCNTVREITVALGEGEMAGASIEIMPHEQPPEDGREIMRSEVARAPLGQAEPRNPEGLRCWVEAPAV